MSKLAKIKALDCYDLSFTSIVKLIMSEHDSDEEKADVLEKTGKSIDSGNRGGILGLIKQVSFAMALNRIESNTNKISDIIPRDTKKLGAALKEIEKLSKHTENDGVRLLEAFLNVAAFDMGIEDKSKVQYLDDADEIIEDLIENTSKSTMQFAAEGLQIVKNNVMQVDGVAMHVDALPSLKRFIYERNKSDKARKKALAPLQKDYNKAAAGDKSALFKVIRKAHAATVMSITDQAKPMPHEEDIETMNNILKLVKYVSGEKNEGDNSGEFGYKAEAMDIVQQIKMQLEEDQALSKRISKNMYSGFSAEI